jgi:hypothetical protein
MINLQPIHSKIRAELHRRQKLLNREGILFEGPQTDGTGKKKADANNIFAKSTWIRMVGLIKDDKPVIIGGGLLKENQEAYYGFEDMYNSPRNTGDNQYRPMPGVKSISVEYKNTLATLRTATINWTCWSFDDVTKYTPYFLKPGRTVILEWGYSYSDNDMVLHDINEKSPDMILAHKKMMENSFNSNGTYDGMIGLVTNFEWSTRDDGGIDCTTNISSMGLDILKQRITPVDNINVAKTDKNDNRKVELKQNFQTFLRDISTKLEKFKHVDDGGIGNEGMPLQWIKNRFEPSTGADPRSHELYISWGWIEDNILNKYLSKVDAHGVVISSIRSIEPILKDNGDQHTIETAGLAETEGLPPDQLAWQSTKISSHDKLISPDYKFFILPGQSHRNVDDLTDVHPILRDFNKDFPTFQVTDDPAEYKNLKIGYMRNIMFNWNYLITNVFNDASDITSALKKLFERMNENVGIWDLQLVSAPDRPGTLKIVDMNLTKQSVKSLLKIPSELDKYWETVTGGLFHFPVMGKDSIVTAQSLNAKITNEMAMAMMWDNAEEITSPSQMGGIKIVAASKLGSAPGDKDGLIHDIKPGWNFDKFGNKSAGVNSKFDTESGPDVGIEAIDKKGSDSENHDDETAETVKSIHTLKFTEKQFFDFNFKSEDKDTLTGSVYGYWGNLLNTKDTPWLDVMKYLITYDEKESVSIDFDPMVALEISLTLDGISGIFPGNCFTSNYLPSQYKDRVLFQVMSSTQELDASSWKTSIVGKMRISVRDQLDTEKSDRNFLKDEKAENEEQIERTENSETKAELMRRLGYIIPDAL